jgi:hypothetical protein
MSLDFTISIETFGTGRWCRDKIETSQTRSRLLDCQDKLFEDFLDPDMIETNRDPHPKLQFRIKLRKREERESERKR